MKDAERFLLLAEESIEQLRNCGQTLNQLRIPNGIFRR